MGRHDRSHASRSEVAAQRLTATLLDVGIDGLGPFEPATQVARDALDATHDAEDAVRRIVSQHLRLAAAGGFVTGLGGFVTLPIALPANVASFYALATRMVAVTAAVRGYDVGRDVVRTSVLLTLVGKDATEVLRKAGIAPISGRVTGLVLGRLPAPALMVVQKAIGFRLLVKVGEKGLSRLGRAVPLAGGVIGAGLDAALLRTIAQEADRQFPGRGAPVLRQGPREVTGTLDARDGIEAPSTEDGADRGTRGGRR